MCLHSVFPLKSTANPWSNGPDPFPRSSPAAKAPEIYSFATATASLSSMPLAKLAAMALDRVQPVPWVLGLSIFLPANQVQPSPSQSRSLASFKLCPPLQRTAQP